MMQAHTRLPSLKALQAFEAAARLNSFTAAAGALYVTQGAISRAIKGLEEDLGVALFRRRGRHLELTVEGRRFAGALHDAFGIMSAATSDIRRQPGADVLTLAMLPSFAAKWLVPRLGDFLNANPRIDLRISASLQLTTFDDGVDLAIRYGTGNWPDTESQLLFRESIFPVCSPDLVAPKGPLGGPADLAKVTVLHGHVPADWQAWWRAAGLDDLELRRGPYFNDAAALIQAAIDGTGVALGRKALVDLDIAAGRLVKPFGPAVRSQFSYFLVRPAGRPPPRHLTAVEDWLLAQAPT